ncbi:hypothetical protein NDU88_008140 [Pleurodeles waltl]|uniref:Uncharacterized protein n=1 Tax=Pleurodeles waltl TaxID=8319 RepID=A0AAV7PS16_PLEWA|nr:hypothetical protein NDU88_008140 [Pleurodeles waltl]
MRRNRQKRRAVNRRTTTESGDPGVPREAAEPEEQERSEDTLRGRHVPGGAWLTKCVWESDRGSSPVKRGAGKKRREKHITGQRTPTHTVNNIRIYK